VYKRDKKSPEEVFQPCKTAKNQRIRRPQREKGAASRLLEKIKIKNRDSAVIKIIARNFIP